VASDAGISPIRRSGGAAPWQAAAKSARNGRHLRPIHRHPAPKTRRRHIPTPREIHQTLDKSRFIFRLSGEVVTHLGAMEGRPWAEFGKIRKPITTTRLAILLSEFQVFPAPFSGGQQRGYHLSQFEDAFARYL
jgi:Protein of unknown function (DUF3631)